MRTMRGSSPYRTVGLLAGACVVGTLLAFSIGSPRPPVGAVQQNAGAPTAKTPSFDDRPKAYTEPRRVLARIQTDLERAAAGKPRMALPPDVERDPLEGVVDAFRAYLSGDLDGATNALDAVAANGTGRLDVLVKAMEKEKYGAYVKQNTELAKTLGEAVKAGEKTSDAVLGRL